MPLLDRVKLRNRVLQRVIRLMSLSRPARGRRGRRGRISYAQLGINQLGAVYEALLSYRGFFAEEDLHEVMVSVNRGLVPLAAAIDSRSDAAARESAETEERALVYVAATRARKELLVLSYGAPSPLLGRD